MKRKIKLLIAVAAVCFLSFSADTADAQIPVVGLVSGVIKKIITALDLKVQELQNQTIALQNAEKNLENSMSLGNLNDITSWIGKERTLYQNYYKELATVKTIISDYDEVERIISEEEDLVQEYKNAQRLFSQDKHFSASELQEMATVYNGILQESIRNLDEAALAVKSVVTQMSDAERLLLIHKASAGMQKNLNDLRQYNNNNVWLSLQRATDEQDKQAVKKLYGIN